MARLTWVAAVSTGFVWDDRGLYTFGVYQVEAVSLLVTLAIVRRAGYRLVARG